jgi:alkylation response protein AidB-like acyl-CoA dehydrogenase
MHLETDPEIARFRDQVRTWLEENVPAGPRPATPGPGLREFDCAWQRRQFEGGWAGIDWPEEYGGRGLSLLQQIIWYEELVRAGAPSVSIFNVAFGHAGPTLIACGTEEQKQFYLPRILQGQTPWCQGFSEPDAGSDLAALRCRAVVDGDHLVVNGTKIWTTYGEHSDYCELLVRTDSGAGRHGGMTWVIMDMHLPGVDIRPIVSIDGWPHNCAVFYDDVHVPLANVVGRIGDGWNVAMVTLASERGPGFLHSRLARVAFIDDLIDFARDSGRLADPGVHDELAQLRAEATALRSMAYYQASVTAIGETPKADTTAVRAFYVQLLVKSARTAMSVVGGEALEMSHWSRHWLEDFSGPIAGGTIDIQKNIIGERVLGLPR